MDAIREWAAVGAMVASVVVWLVRLESRASLNSRDLLRLEQRIKEQRKEDNENRAVEHKAIMTQIADMREEMRTDLRELRQDLKDAMTRP